MGKFGNETVGAFWESVTNYIVGSRFTCTGDGVGESIFAYVAAEGVGVPFKCAIFRYSDLALKGITIEKTGVPSKGGWVEFPFIEPKPSFVNGTDYIPVVWSSFDEYGNIGQICYDNDDNGMYQSRLYNAFPNVLTPTWRNDRVHSIYCYYTGVPPSEYSTSVASLKTFRGKILTDLVGSRLVAGLDANHDSMMKMHNVVSGLSVTPYLFGKVREKALALRMNAMDVGEGGIRKIVANYTGALRNYPMNPPYQVPQRQLPQVDVYSYIPLADVDLLKETDMAHIKNFVLIQAPSDTFEESPEAENTFYDYYNYFPQRRVKGVWRLVNPQWGSSWYRIRGELTFFRRTLTPSGTTDDVYYYLCIFVEPVVHKADETIVENPPVVVWHPEYVLPRPAVTCSIAGQHILSTDFGMYTNPNTRDQTYILGFVKWATDLAVEAEEDMWLNEWTLTMAVSPEGGGTTTPTIGDHKIQAEYAVACTAFPSGGFVFDHWEKDGVNKGSTNPINVPMDKDITMKAVFVPT